MIDFNDIQFFHTKFQMYLDRTGELKMALWQFCNGRFRAMEYWSEFKNFIHSFIKYNNMFKIREKSGMTL